MKRVVVTGGAGFIGSHLTEALLDRGFFVTVLDDLSTGYKSNLAKAHGVRLIIGSILDQEGALRDAMEGADAIFHLAAVASVPRSVKEPLLSHAINSTGTLMVLEEARRAGVKRVVYAASSSAIGDIGDRPRTETLFAMPKSPYAVAKYTGELYGNVYYHIHGLEVVCLRYFNVYGPRQRPRGPYSNVIPAFFKAGLQYAPATIYGDGTQTRDFTYVTDVVRATILALDAKGVAGLTINIGSGRSVSVLELANAVGMALGRSLELRYAPERPEEIRHMRVDPMLAEQLLGFVATAKLQDGLREIAEWFRSEYLDTEIVSGLHAKEDVRDFP